MGKLDSISSMETDEITVSNSSMQAPGQGLSQFMAVIFVVGAVAGIGVLALAHAIADAGWSGVVLLVFCAAVSGYCGSKLGTCWAILEERWEEYKGQNRKPYPSIAYRAFGKWMRNFVSVIQVGGLFGYGTVFVLLAGQLVQQIVLNISKQGFQFSFCYWVLILAACMAPLMLLGTPKDFWPAAFGALGATIIACVIVIVLCALDLDNKNRTKTTFNKPTFETFFGAFGSIMFSYGGAAQFPTIQNDMLDRRKFPMAVVYATVVLVVVYVTVSIMGYVTYGSDVSSNILLSLGSSWPVIVVECLFIVHLVCAFLIVINPMCQEVEEHLKVPSKFSWKRIPVRFSIMLCIVFVSESVPQFSKVLNLVGATLAGLTTFCLPPLFYIRLCSMKRPEWPERNLPLWEKVLLYELIVVGIVGTIAASVSAVADLVKPGAFTVPCYVNLTAASAASLG